MPTSKKLKRLLDAYRFAGFRPVPQVSGVFGDAHARVVRLTRRSKKPSAMCVGECTRVGTIGRYAAYATSRVGHFESTLNSKFGVCGAEAARR